jgi:hypothetical protein
MRKGLTCRSREDPTKRIGIELDINGVCRYVVSVGEACGAERMILGKSIVPVCNLGNERLICQSGVCQNIARLGEQCENHEPVAYGPAYCAEGPLCVKPSPSFPGICEAITSTSTISISTVRPRSTDTVVQSTVVNPPITTQTDTVVSSPRPTGVSGASSVIVSSIVGISISYFLF